MPVPTESNLALGQPALQSSVSPWSRSRDRAADARGANDGRIDGRPGFHTAMEDRPWWQVDLGRTSTVRAVRLFNRRDCADRLRRFTVLVSLDGERWLPVYSKKDGSVFGDTASSAHVAELPVGSVARFVRIQLDGRNYLHFCECEVLGIAVPDAELAAVEAAFDQRVDEDARAETERMAALGQGRRGTVVRIGRHAVFVDVERYGPVIVRTLSNGDYEGRERGLVAALLRPGDRVLELGTAIGTVSMAAADVVGAENVLSFDANPRMIDDARRNFEANHLGRIEAYPGVLLNRVRFATAAPTIDFHVSRDFWASRLHVGDSADDIVETISVPTRCLEDELARHRATVLLCDIEGGEVDLLADAELEGIRLVVMEVHDWVTGLGAIDDLMRTLVNRGLNIDLHYSGNGMAVLRR